MHEVVGERARSCRRRARACVGECASVRSGPCGSRACGSCRPAGRYAGAVSRSVIVSAVRTPFGRLGGGLASYPATELGSLVIRAALDRVGLESGEVEYVTMGQVLQAGAGQAPARQAAVGAGIPKEVPADTVNKVCASSIRAIEIADVMIRSGEHELVVTGGMESMSNAPYLLPKARFGYRLGNGEVVDHVVFDGLTSTFDGMHMIEQASFVARELGITREEQDEWAYRSHQRAAAAQDEGRFDGRDRRGRRPHGRRGRATRHDAREALRAEARLRSGGDDDRGERARRERRCVVRDRLLGGVCGETRPRAARDHPRAGLCRRRVRVPRSHPGPGGRAGTRQGGQDDRRRRSRRDQRGLRVGREELDADARRWTRRSST